MPNTTCACCNNYEPDPTRRSWTDKQNRYICLDCRPAVLERGLNAIAYARNDFKAHR